MSLTTDTAERELLERDTPAWVTTTDICHRCDDWPAVAGGMLCARCRPMALTFGAGPTGSPGDFRWEIEEAELAAEAGR